jgi:uncharacterized membrane protein YdbT with pleckstrin-like domain
MYNAFRNFCERALRIPPAPSSPPGDEASARVFRAAPRYFQYRLVIWALITAISIVLAAAIMVGPNIATHVAAAKRHIPMFVSLLVSALSLLALLIVLLWRAFALAVLRLDYEKRWYVVTDRSLRIREGVVFIREMTITFANVQNLSISQGPIQRALGLSDLIVETAGGGSVQGRQQMHGNLHTVCFRGIDNAAEVKELIQHRLRALRDSGLGHHEEQPVVAPINWLGERALSALRGVHEEARALRGAAERWAM